MHVGCSSAMRWTPVAEEPVLVPTMHVGCSGNQEENRRHCQRFSTHDARGL